MQDTDIKTIVATLNVAGVAGFTGNYEPLGGGEVNNTYKIDIGNKQLIMRIAKDEGQHTLKNEAHALSLLSSSYIPQLIYFNEHEKIDNRLWILESCLPGSTARRLSINQFNSLGKLLALVHRQPSNGLGTDLRRQFIDSCKAFGDERYLREHPDENLRKFIHTLLQELTSLQAEYGQIKPTLIHSDATLSNTLVNGQQVGLIDWEFSKYSDPMCDFSTMYYEDIEYNQGKWRMKIENDEKQALFGGYESAGGKINEDRIRFWIRFDKLTAAIFLYWRINQSMRATSQAEAEQYQLDYNNIVASLQS